MTFPKIRHITDLLPFISDNPQFRVADQPNGTTVVCYMLQDEDTFRGEHEEWYKECRGITFDTARGHVVSRTLHKFQNVGENDATQPHLIPWDRIIRVMDKRDGSMITFVNIDGKITAKTKKTFTSAEAIAATEFLYQDPARVEWVASLLQQDLTPTFEWTSPKFPIVLTYDKDELTLLQIRDNVFGSYKVLTFENEEFIKRCPFPIVENIKDQFSSAGVVMWNYFAHAQLNTTGVEGWIVQADNGKMWKVKTKWYCDLHHSVTFTRWRDVARTVLEDKSDDLKAAFAMTGRSIEPILEVERRIGEELENMRLIIDSQAEYGHNNCWTAKEMAQFFNKHEYFGLIMRKFRGQEIKWFDWYLKERIHDHSLEVIPTAVQNEDANVDAA